MRIIKTSESATKFFVGKVNLGCHLGWLSSISNEKVELHSHLGLFKTVFDKKSIDFQY